MKYQNPIINGFHPDPSICRVDQDYYIVNSSFEFLPGVPIFHSKDLLNWKKIAHCITHKEQMEFKDCQWNGGIFAPTIRYQNQQFYMTTTNVARPGAFAPGGSGNFIMTASQIEGPWSLPMWVEQGGIDPSLFWDEDGKVYFQSTMMTSNDQGNMVSGIFQAEINPDTGELLSESKLITYGCGSRFPEGPHLLKKDGWYYLLLAEGGTELGHMVTISRARQVWGPFESCPNNPILTARNENDPEIAGLGHGDLIEDHKGNWWICYLGYQMSENYHHHMGRETCLAPVEWIDGWPVVNKGETPGRWIETDDLPIWGDTACSNIDRKVNEYLDFSKDQLSLEWNSFRTFFHDFSYDQKKGVLCLFGNEKTLNDKSTPAYLGRRIDHFEFLFETVLDFEGNEGEEAGLAIAHTPFVHTELVITKKENQKMLSLKKRLFDMETVEEIMLLEKGDIHLTIIGDRYKFEFYVATENGPKRKIGEGLVKLFSSEVVGGCIGTYIGIYASGNGKKMHAPAYFKSVHYEWLVEKQKKAMFFED